MKRLLFFSFALFAFLTSCFNSSKTMETDGGIKVTIEINMADFVNKMSNNSSDSIYQICLQKTITSNYKNLDEFFSTFTNTLKEMNSSVSLASYFATFENKEKISFQSTDEEVLKVLKNEFKYLLENSKSIISARLEKFIEQPIIAKIVEPNLIHIDIPGISDEKRISNFIQASGNLGFWETYNNVEVYPFLESANKKLLELGYGITNQMEDSSKENSSLINQLKDENKKADQEFKNNNPLFAVLYPSVDNEGQLTNSAVVGLSEAKDTATVNQYLSIKSIKNEFPYNLKFLWTIKPINNTEVFQLIGIKVTNRDGLAPLDGTYITDASVETGNYNPQISISMNNEGAKLWERLTKENIGKQIAIVLDNYVYSFPTVYSEIKGGKSAISGDFTIQEAKDLVSILTAGCYPIQIRIKNIEVVNPKLK